MLGSMPRLFMLFFFGVSYRAVVTTTAEPSESVATFCHHDKRTRLGRNLHVGLQSEGRPARRSPAEGEKGSRGGEARAWITALPKVLLPTSWARPLSCDAQWRGAGEQEQAAAEEALMVEVVEVAVARRGGRGGRWEAAVGGGRGGVQACSAEARISEAEAVLESTSRKSGVVVSRPSP